MNLKLGRKISENWAEQNETKEKELEEATEGQKKLKRRLMNIARLKERLI